MNMHEAAAELHGNEYGREGSRDLWASMKASGLVAIFGASDDLTEFRGAIYDEAGAGEVTEHRLTQKGLPENDCDDSDCPYFRKLLKNIPVAVTARWDHEGYSWFIETDLPHAPFDIVEDDEKYCRGVVIALADLPHA